MKVGDGRQIRVCCGSQSFVYARVHSRRKVEVWRRIYPDDPEVFSAFGAVPDSQRILDIPRGHLVVQSGLLARRWEMLKLPGLIDAVFDHVWAEGHFQLLGYSRRRNPMIAPLQSRNGSTGERSLFALEARVVVVQMGAGEGERGAFGQKSGVVQQVTKFLPYECVSGGSSLGRRGFTPGIGGISEQVGQCHAQTSPDSLDLVIDVAEEGRPVDARWFGLLSDFASPVVGLKDAMMFEDKRAVGEL